MKCFYHESDLDGRCSGAIVKHFHPECQMLPMNYSDKIDWESIEAGETVYMVDFTLQPYKDMVGFWGLNVVWIDHHHTAIKALPECRDYEGLREVGYAGCELTWMYFQMRARAKFPEIYCPPMPEFVRLLGRYDVWDHSDPNVLPFQFGLRMVQDTRPEADIWKRLFDDDRHELTGYYIVKGKTTLEYQASENEAYCRTYSFPTTLDGYRAIAINKGKTNSQIFDSVWDPEKYDIMLAFCRLPLPKRLWTVSIYSTRQDIDCGLIAKVYGGGGHKGAAGFQCENLPFDY